MNAKTSPALPIFLITLLLTAILVITMLAIEPTLAGPMRQAGDPLPPAAAPHAIGFDDATEVTANWAGNTGIWVHKTENSPQEYVQEDVVLGSAISLYKRSIESQHAYTVEVSLQHLDGDTGGILFNAPNPDDNTTADTIRYNRTLGVVDWGAIKADGSFLSVGSTDVGIPSDDEYHTLRVAVAGDGFSAYFDDSEVITSALTLAPTAYVGVYTAGGSFAFRSMTVTVTEASTPTPIATATPISGELIPGVSYILGFTDTESINDWQPALGTWSYDRGYVQSDQNNANAYSYYRRRVKGDYDYEIALSHLGGDVGGGLLFNAPNSNSLVGAMLVAFNPESTNGDGSILYWGYFDSNSTLVFLGDHIVTPSAIDGVERSLRVQVAAGNYSIWLNDSLFLSNKPFVPDVQVSNPYVGLYTSQSSTRFDTAKVMVSPYAQPTATPEPTSTISPTPTVSPTPTHTVTPDPNHLTPRETPYVIGFGSDVPGSGPWPTHRGSWIEEITGLKQRDVAAEHAMSFYGHTIAGNYEYEVTFSYLTPEPTATAQSEKDGGLIFNSPGGQFNGSFMITFEGNSNPNDQSQSILWGYFEKETEDPDFVEVGRVTGQIAVTDGISRTIKVVVADNRYSIWNGDQQIVSRASFPSDVQRVAEPSIGVYANKTIMKFTDGEVKVTDYTGVEETPTHAPTPTTTVQSTPRPTRTTTPTPTWTPGTPTATATPVAPSVLPTPTNTPFVINQPPRPTPLPPIVVSTPTTKPATQTAIAAAVIAATATDTAATATAVFSQGATATTAALSATQTAAIIPTTPAPTFTPISVVDMEATNTAQANATVNATVNATANVTVDAGADPTLLTPTATGTPLAVAQASVPASAATETAAAQTAVAQFVITTTIIDGQPVVVVIATPTPTQRPLEEPPQTPTEPAAPVKVAFWARIMNAIVTSAAIIWLGVGLAVLIGIAAVLAGIAFQPEEEESPYELHDDLDGAAIAGDEALDEAEIDRILDNLEEEIGAVRAAGTAETGSPKDPNPDGGESDDTESRRDSNQGDNWPTSLP